MCMGETILQYRKLYKANKRNMKWKIESSRHTILFAKLNPPRREIYSGVACERVHTHIRARIKDERHRWKRDKGDARDGGSKKVLFDTLADILNNTTAAEYAAPRYIARL